MKRSVVFLALALCAVSLVSAQGRDKGRGPDSRQREQYKNRGPGSHRQGFQRQGYQRQRNQRQGEFRNFPRLQAESASVSGSLTVSQGMIAVENEGITYLTFGLNRFVGFIDGLKEGAQVTLEGTATVNPKNDKVKVLRVRKMTLNGKDYDFSNSFRNPAPPTRQRQPNR